MVGQLEQRTFQISTAGVKGVQCHALELKERRMMVVFPSMMGGTAPKATPASSFSNLAAAVAT